MIEQLLHSDNSYLRENDYLDSYIKQVATFLSKTKGIGYEEAYTFVKKNLSHENFELKNPLVEHTLKDDEGNITKEFKKLSDYLYDSYSDGDFIAPTFTTYLNPKKRVSLLSDFIAYNKKERSKAKKEGFEAYVKYNALTVQAANIKDEVIKKELETEFNQQLLIYQIKDAEQNNAKIANNSISGAHLSVNPLRCRSTHSTLTSMTRISSNVTNLLAEKMIYGNRYYPNYESVVENITNILTYYNKEEFINLVNKYNLYLPNVDDTMDVIIYSTGLYFKNSVFISRIRKYIECLMDYELAAFVYIGDLFQLKKFNSTLITKMFDDILESVIGSDDVNIINEYEEGLVALAMLINSEQMKGKGKDFGELAISNPELISLVAGTLENVNKQILKYSDFFDCVLLSNVSPMLVSYSPNMFRRCVIVSDTDSTIYTAANWAEWYSGSLKVTTKANNATYLIGYLLAQSAKHFLAKLSSNMGADDFRLRIIGSKGEFTFPVMVLPGVSKTYFANISTQEANIFAKRKIEIKGVHLKPSNSTKSVVKDAENMMIDVVDTVTRDGEVSIVDNLIRVVELEDKLEKELLSGSSDFFRYGKIKDKAAYKNDNSPYKRHLFWKEIFSDKYGNPGEPPYLCINLSLDLNNKTEIKDWISKIDDKVIADRLSEYIEREKKNKLSTIYVPDDVVKGVGLPKELSLIIDTSKIVMSLLKSHYLILSSLGYELNNVDRMLKDQIDVKRLYDSTNNRKSD